MTDAPDPIDDVADVEDEPILVDEVSLRAGTGMDVSGQVVGVVQMTFANSALPDAEFKIMYVGRADQLRAAGDALRGAFRHVANRVDPDARRRR